MKKLFLLGVVLAICSSVCAMKPIEPKDLYADFKKTLETEDEAFLFRKSEQGEEAFKKSSLFWKDGSFLDEKYIEKIIDKVSNEKEAWEIVVSSINHIGYSLTAMIYFTFCKDSKKENIKKNQKDLLCLADALQVCISRYDSLEKQLKKDLITNMFAVPQKTSLLSKRIKLVRELYK